MRTTSIRHRDASFTDLDVVVPSAPAFRALQQCPPELTSEILRRVTTWEREASLRNRHLQYRDLALRTFENVPELADDAECLALDWADYRFSRNAELLQLMMYAADDEFLHDHVRIVGEPPTIGKSRAPLFVAPHSGPYQALYALLLRLFPRISLFMDAAAFEVLADVSELFVPGLPERTDAILLPGDGVARHAVRNMRTGTPLLVFPEFSLVPDKSLTLDFFGRAVSAPMGPERLAHLARTDVVPIVLRRVGAIDYELSFGSPLWTATEALREGELTRRIFAEIERMARAAPAQWWCWEIFDSMIAVDGERDPVGGGRR